MAASPGHSDRTSAEKVPAAPCLSKSAGVSPPEELPEAIFPWLSSGEDLGATARGIMQVLSGSSWWIGHQQIKCRFPRPASDPPASVTAVGPSIGHHRVR